MNNFVNLDRLGILLFIFVYINMITTISIHSVVLSQTVVLSDVISYNVTMDIFIFVIFLITFYVLKLSKQMIKYLVISMLISAIIVVWYSASIVSFILNKIFILFLISIFVLYISYCFFKIYIQTLKLFKYKYLYVDKNTFTPNPILLLIMLYVYIIASILLSLKIVFTRDFNEIITTYIFYTLTSLTYIYLFYNLLYKYKSAYAVLFLSSSKKIDISLLNIPNSIAAHKWFKNNIEPYVYHAHYNEENGTITFDDEDDIINSNEHSEVDECNLDKSIAVINSLLENENSHEIAGILKSIIDKLNKMNHMHKEKYQFNKYIHHINERYIPYVKSLVQAYYNNIQLGLELTKTMQEKITASLKKIDDIFEKSIHEMYNKNMLELESYMQAMDIILNYKSAGSKV